MTVKGIFTRRNLKKMCVLARVLDRERVSRGPSLGGGDEDKTDSGDLSLYSPLKVVIFVALMCVMLVLMYFFYKWLGELPVQTLLPSKRSTKTPPSR